MLIKLKATETDIPIRYARFLIAHGLAKRVDEPVKVEVVTTKPNSTPVEKVTDKKQGK